MSDGRLRPYTDAMKFFWSRTLLALSSALLLSAPHVAGAAPATGTPVRSDADRARYGPLAEQHPCGVWNPRFREMQNALATASSRDQAVAERWGAYGASLARAFVANLEHIPDENRTWAPMNQLQAARSLANAYQSRFDLLVKHQPANVQTYYGVQIATMNWDATCLAIPTNPHLYIAPDGSPVTPH